MKRKSKSKKIRRNCKKDAPPGFFPAPLAAVLVLVGVLSLGYLWLCGQCDAAGRRIKDLERQRTEVRRRYLNEEYKWHNLRSQENIERALKMHGLEMSWPERRRAVHISLREWRFDDESLYRLARDGAGDLTTRYAMQ